MVPLQQLLRDIESTSPWALLLFVYVAIAAVRRYRKSPPSTGRGCWPIVEETWLAVSIILSIWAVQCVLHFTVGDDRSIGGISVHKVLDFGHLAVVLNWMMSCLLRLLPHE